MAPDVNDVEQRLGRIKVLALDVDGVLTDGRLHYGDEGEKNKVFHVRDGAGIKALIDAGIEVCVVSGRGGPALAHRLKELGVKHAITGCDHKWPEVERLLGKLGKTPEELAYIGDDTPDVPVLSRAGLAICVADAHPDAKRVAHWVTQRAGGAGAVREVADRLLARDKASVFSVIIPARYGSSRFAGKPLVPLCGEPMILHTLKRAQASGATRTVVATDDRRIAEVVERAGGQAIMTRTDHVSGSDRIAEAVASLGLGDDAIVVNVQGDEPLLAGELIARVARALDVRPSAGIATLATSIETPDELFSPHVVKVVLNDNGYASYFSRAPIPWVRGVSEQGAALKTLPPGTSFLRHIGLYAYRVGVLQKLTDAPVAPSEQAESLEQLRALALGIPIHVSVVPGLRTHGVDTPEDVARVEALLRQP